MIFVEKDSLVSNEHAVSTIDWDKPVDKYGIYDPTVPLELWQFTKLPLNEQLDYLLWNVSKTVEGMRLDYVGKTYQIPCSTESISVAINARWINPRMNVGDEYANQSVRLREEKERSEETVFGPGHNSRLSRMVLHGKYKGQQFPWTHPGSNTHGWFNYDRYQYVRLKHKQEGKWRTSLAYSANHRTTFIWFFLKFLIEYKPEKYSHLQSALEYYETTKAFVKKPRKLRSV